MSVYFTSFLWPVFPNLCLIFSIHFQTVKKERKISFFQTFQNFIHNLKGTCNEKSINTYFKHLLLIWPQILYNIVLSHKKRQKTWKTKIIIISQFVHSFLNLEKKYLNQKYDVEIFKPNDFRWNQFMRKYSLSVFVLGTFRRVCATIRIPTYSVLTWS